MLVYTFKTSDKIVSVKEIYGRDPHVFCCRLIRSIPSTISYPIGNSCYIQRRNTIERGQEGAVIVVNSGGGGGL